MELAELVKYVVECKRLQKLLPSEGGNGHCEACPLNKEISWSLEIEGYDSISKITLTVSPCLLLEEVAGRVKIPKARANP